MRVMRWWRERLLARIAGCCDVVSIWRWRWRTLISMRGSPNLLSMIIVNRKKTPESSLSSLTPEEKCSIVIISLTKNETLKNPKTFLCHASFIPPKIGKLFSSFLLLTTCLLFHCNMIWCGLLELIMMILPLFFFFFQVSVVIFPSKNPDDLLFAKPKTHLSISFFSRQNVPSKRSLLPR